MYKYMHERSLYSVVPLHIQRIRFRAPWILKSTDVQVPQIKWCSIYMKIMHVHVLPYPSPDDLQ